MTVEAKDVNVATDYSARLEGQQTVEIRPEVGGLIKKICIHEGDKVKRGKVLFVINPVPYRAAYDEASAYVKSAEDLDHTEVKSPVDGVAGMIAYRVGALNKICEIGNIYGPILIIINGYSAESIKPLWDYIRQIYVFKKIIIVFLR